MTKPTGSICNLDCTYCFYLEKEKLYPSNKNWKMSERVLESYIKQYINVQQTNEITFAWQGGEPTLLGVDYFKRIIELQKKYANGKLIYNTFQTNGVLLNDEWGKFFADNNFLVGLSIDGPEDIHNKYRVYKGGQNSFNKVMKGLELLKKHNVEFNTLTCVQRDNSYKPLEVYNFLKEIGSGFMQFIPIVERTAVDKKENELSLISPNIHKEAFLTEWSVESLQYGKFLSEIFNEWVQNDVGNYFVQIFDISLESWMGYQQSLCVFKETCGNAMAMEHNGDIYSCDHYVYEENKLGNIISHLLKEMVDSGQQMKFGLDKKMKLPNYCKKCEYLFACNGECPKHRFNSTPEGEEGLNYLCEGYKYFFNYVNSYMNYMANELSNQRPPSNVMEWAKKKN